MASNTTGRPKGKKNIEYMRVEQIPAACPKCHSTNLTVKKGAKPLVRDIAGVTRNGQTYTRVKWHRTVCECGQHVSVRSLLAEKSTAEK